MTNTFYLNVVDSHQELFHGEITEVTAPGTMGSLTIMTGHTPLISSLNLGELVYTTANGESEVLFISGGILEVQPTLVTVLADTILRNDESDAKAAEEAIERAKQKIKNTTINSASYADLAREIQIMKALVEMSRTTSRLRIKRY